MTGPDFSSLAAALRTARDAPSEAEALAALGVPASVVVPRPDDDPPFVPGTYVVTFDRIGAHRPGPLTVTVQSPEDLESAIRTYANMYTRSGEITVVVEAPEPGRSVGSGWIAAGGRDAGGFTWKPAP